MPCFTWLNIWNNNFVKAPNVDFVISPKLLSSYGLAGSVIEIQILRDVTDTVMFLRFKLWG